jgi:hypothetical protein
MMLVSRRTVVVLTALLASAGSVRADYIDNFRIGSWFNGVGYEGSGPYTAPNPYIGQTFQAIGGLAQSLTIAAHPYDALEDSMRFHVLITTVQPNGVNPAIFCSSRTPSPPRPASYPR